MEEGNLALEEAGRQRGREGWKAGRNRGGSWRVEAAGEKETEKNRGEKRVGARSEKGREEGRQEEGKKERKEEGGWAYKYFHTLETQWREKEGRRRI